MEIKMCQVSIGPILLSHATAIRVAYPDQWCVGVPVNQYNQLVHRTILKRRRTPQSCISHRESQSLKAARAAFVALWSDRAIANLSKGRLRKCHFGERSGESAG